MRDVAFWYDEEMSRIVSLWLFHQVQVKNWRSLLSQHRLRSTTLISIWMWKCILNPMLYFH